MLLWKIPDAICWDRDDMLLKDYYLMQLLKKSQCSVGLTDYDSNVTLWVLTAAITGRALGLRMPARSLTAFTQGICLIPLTNHASGGIKISGFNLVFSICP